MKRALLLTTGVLVVAALIVGVMIVKRVPDGSEAVRVTWSGDLISYGSGYHFVPPGTRDFIVYPTGRVKCRFPKYGSEAVLTEAGEPVAVAFEFDLDIPPGSSRKIYERFTEDFDSAVRRLIQAAAEIEAAGVPASVDPTHYLDAVAANVRAELDPLGVSVAAYSMPVWGEDEAGNRSARAADGVPERPPRKVIVLGVDGGDWLNLQPLVDAGKLPNFARLLRDGATGPLETIEPMLSPLLWTSIATGKYPEEHGILNFTVVDEETGQKVPVTRRYRKVDAFWNMLGDYGRKVAVVGWLATDPAEKVNGIMVTDRAGYLAFAPDESGIQTSGAVYPEERTDEVAGLVVHGDHVSYEEFERFIHIPRDEFLHHRALDFDPKDSINNLILLYASTRTFENIGLHLLDSDAPDLLAVYFEWVDAVSHLFMLHSPPKMSDVPDEDYRKFKDAVEQSYIVQDQILGEFIDRMDENTILMVVSDHGFKSGKSRLKNRPEIWAGNAAKWHRKNGIVALYGNGIKHGFHIPSATIMDVAPTILSLQGLPHAADMPGRVLGEAFEPELAQQLNSTTVATLQREREPDQAPAAAGGAASEQAIKKLEALGYLTPDNADAHNNLGQRYQERGDFLKAIEEYKKAISMRPAFYSAYNNLAVCYGKLGRLEEAEEALLKTIELKPDDYYAMNNLAVTFVKTGRMKDAREMAERAVRTEPGYVNGRITLGSVYAMSGEWELAEKEFLKALEIDPEAPGAASNLQKVRAQMQKQE
jgi:predicted AlkP superfamily phosphohydrolase/phosphomutase/Flp pilus assembly protein TadD